MRGLVEMGVAHNRNGDLRGALGVGFVWLKEKEILIVITTRFSV